MNQPVILAVILNWRQAEATIACVRNLQGSIYPHLDILVIDNHSDDNSVSILRQSLPEVLVEETPENLGFAGGCNYGLQFAKEQGYEWILLLNNDTFAAIDMVSHLVEEIEKDIALLSPKVYYTKDPKRIWFAGGQRHVWLLEMYGTGKGKKESSKWSQSKDVDYLVGTCLLVNMQAATQVGFLDERYFMYYEDLDWCLRFQDAKYRLRLVAKAHLFHDVSLSSGGEGSPHHRYYLARSSILFFRRHAGRGIPFLIVCYRTLSALKAILSFLLHGRWETAVAYLHGLRDGFQLIRPKKEAKD